MMHRFVFACRDPLIALFEFCSRHRLTYIIPSRDGMQKYLERLRLYPRWIMLGLRRDNIHKFWRSDSVKDGFHCHPWNYRTIILKGSYIEHFPDATFKIRRPGDVVHATAETLHRVELFHDSQGNELPVYTFFSMGKKRRATWGFLVNGKWWTWYEWITIRKGSA